MQKNKNETISGVEEKKTFVLWFFSEVQILLPLSLSHSLSLSFRLHRALLAASTTFGGAPAIGAPPSPLASASLKVSRSVADAAFRSAAACLRACAAETSPVVWMRRFTTASEGCGMEYPQKATCGLFFWKWEFCSEERRKR